MTTADPTPPASTEELIAEARRDTLCLPVPRGYEPRQCPMCRGAGVVALTTPPGPRTCPTCRGGGIYAETYLTVGGMLGRARQLGVSA